VHTRKLHYGVLAIPLGASSNAGWASDGLTCIPLMQIDETPIIDDKTILVKLVGRGKFRILGACNPALAYEALKLESHVGTMLPCNVIVRDAGNGQTEVAAIDPVASMQAIHNPALILAAQNVRAKLERAIAHL